MWRGSTPQKNRHYNSAEPVTSPKTNVDSNSFFGNMNANMIVFVQEKNTQLANLCDAAR